jgi:hypothetical protein
MLKAKESVSFRKLTATPRSAQPPKKSFFFALPMQGGLIQINSLM